MRSSESYPGMSFPSRIPPESVAHHDSFSGDIRMPFMLITRKVEQWKKKQKKEDMDDLWSLDREQWQTPVVKSVSLWMTEWFPSKSRRYPPHPGNCAPEGVYVSPKLRVSRKNALNTDLHLIIIQ